jgi:hypothetical protein
VYTVCRFLLEIVGCNMANENQIIIGAGQDTARRAPKITRAWAMPNSLTFSIKPIREIIELCIADCVSICDPFVRNSPFKSRCVSNDLDTSVESDFHMDALDFLRSRADSEFDAVLFDPPYSPRQVSECYKSMGLSVNMATTQASFWSYLKREIQRITAPGGVVVTCGWNSGGIGQKYGFEIEQILLVAHGGWHNDTIVTIERRTSCAKTKSPAQYVMEICHTATNRPSPKC